MFKECRMVFFSKFGVYFFSNILNAIVPFLIIPILTRELEVAEYGQLVVFQLLLQFYASVIGLGAI